MKKILDPYTYNVFKKNRIRSEGRRRNKDIIELLNRISSIDDENISNKTKKLIVEIGKYQSQPQLIITAKLIFLITKMMLRKTKQSHKNQKISERNKNNLPSKRAELFLYFLIPREKRDVIIGDLVETYNTIMIPKFGVKKARFWFWFQTVLNVFSILKLRWIMLIALGKSLFEKIAK